jgi:hypothetical protein
VTTEPVNIVRPQADSEVPNQNGRIYPRVLGVDMASGPDRTGYAFAVITGPECWCVGFERRAHADGVAFSGVRANCPGCGGSGIEAVGREDQESPNVTYRRVVVIDAQHRNDSMWPRALMPAISRVQGERVSDLNELIYRLSAVQNEIYERTTRPPMPPIPLEALGQLTWEMRSPAPAATPTLSDRHRRATAPKAHEYGRSVRGAGRCEVCGSRMAPGAARCRCGARR